MLDRDIVLARLKANNFNRSPRSFRDWSDEQLSAFWDWLYPRLSKYVATPDETVIEDFNRDVFKKLMGIMKVLAERGAGMEIRRGCLGDHLDNVEETVGAVVDYWEAVKYEGEAYQEWLDAALAKLTRVEREKKEADDAVGMLVDAQSNS